MKTPSLLPALAAVLFASTTPQLMGQAPVPERTVRAIPSGAFSLRAPSPDARYYPYFLQTPRRDNMEYYGPLYVREESYQIDPGMLEELVRQRFPSMDDGDSEISIGRHVTLIEGSTEEVQAIEKTLRGLAKNFRGALDVRAQLWSLKDGERFDTVMNAGSFASFREGRQPLWSGRARGVAGEVILLDASRIVPYVSDASVEVAQKANSGLPEVQDLIEGLQLRVECEASHRAGSAVVFGDLLVAELERELVQRSTGDEDLPTLDGPQLQQTRTTFSAAIPEGGACALWSLGEAGGPEFVVTVEVDFDSVAPVEGFTLFPIGGLSSDRLSIPLYVDTVQRMSRDMEIFFEDEPAAIGVDQLMELVQRAFAEQLEQEGNSMQESSRRLILMGDPSLRRGVEAFLGQVADSLLRNVSVDLRVDSVAADANRNPAIGVARGPASIAHRLVVPCLHGRAVTALRGLETTEVADYWLEIAQEAVQTDPATSSVFSGLSIRARPHFDGEDLYLTLDGQVTDMGKIIRRPLEQKENGDLWWHRVSHQYISHHGSLARGQGVSLGDGAIIDRPGARLRSYVTLR